MPVHVSVRMLAVRDDFDDKITGFRAGADDYLTQLSASQNFERSIDKTDISRGGEEPHV